MSPEQNGSYGACETRAQPPGQEFQGALETTEINQRIGMTAAWSRPHHHRNTIVERSTQHRGSVSLSKRIMLRSTMTRQTTSPEVIDCTSSKSVVPS
jgi:hypothetical protein